MSGTSPKKEIVLKPNNVFVKQKANELMITYKAKNYLTIIVFGLIFIGAAYYAGSNAYAYMNISKDRKAAYEAKRTVEVEKIQAQHRKEDAKFREDIEWEADGIDMNISLAELSVSSREAFGTVSVAGKELTLEAAQQELQQLKQRKQRLVFMLDSIQQVGAVRDLNPSELEVKLAGFNRVHNNRLEANVDDLMNHIVVPGGVFLLVLLISIWIFRTFFGDDILIINKQQMYIHKKRSNRFGKSKKLFIKNVKQFYCEKKVLGGDYTHTYHSLMYVDDNDQIHVLLQQVREANDAIYIEHKIEEFLGIENVHVRGSMN
ncbi:MAG: hypothetical protein MK212_07705 [Saprospiraceae bacterium]|nr:hypothetical protein [Saprospiraceae bacterium]